MIISISGHAHAGKDEVAACLVTRHGFRRLAFADALKEAAQAIFGLSQEQVHGRGKETIDPYWGRTPREILQLLGTEAVRTIFGDDVWVKALKRRMSPAVRDWVIPDARFLSEVEAVKSWGGGLWRVERPGLAAVNAHVSETQLDGYRHWDRVLVNEGTVKDLWDRTTEAVDGH